MDVASRTAEGHVRHDVCARRLLTTVRTARFGVRIPVGGEIFARVHTGSETHAASCTMNRVASPEVKRPGRGVDHPPPSSAEVKEGVKLYFSFPSRP
jgi:hypothetical protein